MTEQQWKDLAQRVSQLALDAHTAAVAKNQQGLLAAGDALVEVCESCHNAYPWPGR